MAEEMAVGLGREPDGLAPVHWHGDAEAAGTARECHPFLAPWPERDVVAAARQRHGVQIAPLQIEKRRRVGAAIILARGSKALRRKGRGDGLGDAERRRGAGKTDEKCAPIELHLNLHPWH